MQDVLLIYYIVANLLCAGYFADIAKAAQQAMQQLRTAVIGLRNATTVPSVFVGSRPQIIDRAPAVCRELEDWAERLTRMESYVLSMR